MNKLKYLRFKDKEDIYFICYYNIIKYLGEIPLYTVIIQNECECFKKSDLKNNLTFSSQTSAVMSAMKILNQMNTSFCEKHNFILKEDDHKFIISLDKTKTITNCCGNGCCA